MEGGEEQGKEENCLGLWKRGWKNNKWGGKTKNGGKEKKKAKCVS